MRMLNNLYSVFSCLMWEVGEEGTNMFYPLKANVLYIHEIIRVKH